MRKMIRPLAGCALATSLTVMGVPRIFRYEGDTGRSQAGLFDVALHPASRRTGSST